MLEGVGGDRYFGWAYNMGLPEEGGLGNYASMKSIFFFVSLAAAAVLFSSCNTMIGLGRDMRIGGESLENTANKATGGASGSGDVSGAPVY